MNRDLPPTFQQRHRYVISMGTTRPTPLKNILHREMDRSHRPAAHESRWFAGHDGRLTSHIRRIRAARCECGSGAAYANCCMACDRQRTEPGVQYTMPPETVEDLGRRRAIENGFRISAFHTFYKAFRAEHDPTIRFIRALLASARTAIEPRQIIEWHDRFRRRRRTNSAAGQKS